MKDDNKEIINFEDLFKEEIEERKELRDPDRKKRYGYSIISYFALPIIFMMIFSALFSSIDTFRVTYVEHERVLRRLTYEQHGLVLMDESIYHLYSENYEDYIVSIGQYEHFEILINQKNTLYKSLLIIDDELDLSVLVSIIDGSTATWDGQKNIILITAESQTLPVNYTAESIVISGSITQFTSAASSILNFIVYLSVFPIIVLFIKREIIHDVKVAKTWRLEWLNIIFVGYAILIVGNVAAGFISRVLSNILSITPSDPINQMFIQDALKSNGVVFMVLSAVIIAPILEELVFRKALIDIFNNTKVGLIVSSLAFGAVHLLMETSIQEALVNGMVYFAMGFAFGYIYLKHQRNVFAPIVVHMATNTISIILLLIGFGG